MSYLPSGSGGGGFKTCTIVGTLTTRAWTERVVNGSWNRTYQGTSYSTVTIVINLEDGTYTISGNSGYAVAGDTSTNPPHRGSADSWFTISSITFS